MWLCTCCNQPFGRYFKTNPGSTPPPIFAREPQSSPNRPKSDSTAFFPSIPVFPATELGHSELRTRNSELRTPNSELGTRNSGTPERFRHSWYSGRVLMRREFCSFWYPGYFPSRQSAPQNNNDDI